MSNVVFFKVVENVLVCW